MQAGRSLVPDLPLDLVAGDRAVAVLNKLRLADVTNTPTFGEAGGEWFREIVRALFGSTVTDPVSREIIDRYITEAQASAAAEGRLAASPGSLYGGGRLAAAACAGNARGIA